MSHTLPQKLLSVQKKIGVLTKDSNNPFFKSKYVDLNQVLEVSKRALHEEGLFLVQGPGLNENGRYIETSIIDAESGQSISCRVPFSGSEKNMQEIGAATTYGRRFGIVSLLALEQEDDDGNYVSGKTTPASKPAAKAAPVEAPVPTKLNREAINKALSTYSQVIVGKKHKTQEEVVKMVQAFGVTKKEELTDVQAEQLLNQFKELCK